MASTLRKERQGEIAIALLKHFVRERGFRLKALDKPEDIKELRGVAEKVGIPCSELAEFLRPLCQEVFDEVFGKFATLDGKK